jgi:trehalose 6-phosphate phosphatase
MLPDADANDALFLDFDGTLVEIAPRPAEVIVPAALIPLLQSRQSELMGALGIISGRQIEELDKLLAPLSFAAAGEHGAEVRYGRNRRIVCATPLPAQVCIKLKQLSEKYAGTLLEIKRASAALHFRNVPEHQQAVTDEMQTLVETLEGYELLQGKMVVELKLGNIDKGIAVTRLYQQPAFSGRRPVYIGDDVTDEAGFKAVNELGGISIRVGCANQSLAQYSLADVSAVRGWITGAI